MSSRVDVDEHELVGLAVEHQKLAILRPIQVSEGTCETDIRGGDFLELLLCSNLNNLHWRETTVSSVGNQAAVRRELDVFYPCVLLLFCSERPIEAALDLEGASVEDQASSGPVSDGNQGPIGRPVKRGWVMGQLLRDDLHPAG